MRDFFAHGSGRRTRTFGAVVPSPVSVGRQIDRVRETHIWTVYVSYLRLLRWHIDLAPQDRPPGCDDANGFREIQHIVLAFCLQPTTILNELPSFMKMKTNTSIVLTTSTFVAFTSRPSPPTLNFGPVCPKFYAYLSHYLHAQQAYTDHNIKRCHCFYST
jgi:hypothetical protein